LGAEVFCVRHDVDTGKVKPVGIPTNADCGIDGVVSFVVPFDSQNEFLTLGGLDSQIANLEKSSHELGGTETVGQVFIFIQPLAIMQDGEQLADKVIGFWGFSA
jgi:hypothetical protein